MRILYIYPNVDGFHDDLYHFGLAHIVSITRLAGHDIKVVIVTAKSQYDKLMEEVKSFGPELVGFTSVSSQFGRVKEMASLIKRLDSQIFTVCGGVHPTIFADALLEAPMLDGFFTGESELSFVEFLEKMQNGASYEDNDNFCYVRDGRVVRNKLKPLVQDIDTLPHPDKELYPYKQTILELGFAPFFFTRGCPYQCTYCSNQALADLYDMSRNFPRFRSPESCIQEVEEVEAEYGDLIEYVSIGDDIFGLDNKWRAEFCDKYRERVRTKFMILMRVEMINDKMLTMLKRAGCFKIFFGVESGSEIYRKELMKRKMSNDTIIRAFDLCRKYGLETLAVNIIGMPGETEDMIRETVALNRRIRPTVSGLNIFYPYRGTELGDKCFNEGLVDMERFDEFSNERRETALKYSEEHKKMIMYYYENWANLVYPYNVKQRVKKTLRTMGLLESAKRIKDVFSGRVEAPKRLHSSEPFGWSGS